ncbi:MAG: Rv3235 family protein, partial [Nocardioidaceae bacterium]
MFTPRSGVAEVAARVRQGTRSRAVAARLENVEGQ